jgi:hypothetical protein
MLDQRNASAVLPSGKTRYISHRGLVGPRAGLGGWRREKLLYALEIDDYDVQHFFVDIL